MQFQDSREIAEARLGSVLGKRWRLVRAMAVGGSAWVYMAADGNGGLPVAVKVLHSALGEHPQIVQRFIREAQIAKTIAHRCVASVYDEGRTDDGLPYFAMELLDGETLEERRERKGGRLPAQEVLWAMDEVLGALVAAHGKGIVHRDIKPENIFLTNAQTIKLLDFGIARLQRQTEEETDQATRIGTLMGTLDFMAPEQGRGDWDTVGVKTDLWAVGATMFTLFTGRTVHDEVDLPSQIAAVSSKPAPAVAMLAPELPEAVQFLVDEALQFDASKRWADAASMRVGLRLAYRAMKDAAPDSAVDSSVDKPSRIPRPPLHFAPSIPPMSRRSR